MAFGARLAEERKRLGMKQSEFAAMVGIDVPKQSLYETGKRDLRADYLGRLAKSGVDVIYILTGQRSEGSWLGEGASELLSAYLVLPEEMQEALLTLARSMRGQFHPGSATIHSRRIDYRAD